MTAPVITPQEIMTLKGLGYCHLYEGDDSLKGWISRVEVREVGQFIYSRLNLVPLLKGQTRSYAASIIENWHDQQREYIFRKFIATRFYVGDLALNFPVSRTETTAFCAIRHTDEIQAQKALMDYSKFVSQFKDGETFHDLIGQLAALEDAIF